MATPIPRDEADVPNALFITGQRLRMAGCPSHLVDGLSRYVIQGIRPGDFLSAALSNDLRGVFQRGDPSSLQGLHSLMVALWNEVPAAAWGDSERFEAWIALRGMLQYVSTEASS